MRHIHYPGISLLIAILSLLAALLFYSGNLVAGAIAGGLALLFILVSIVLYTRRDLEKMRNPSS